MKICVLNGSPKGEESITLQYALYLQKKFPEHAFTVLHAAKDVPKMQKDPEAFRQAMETVQGSDGVIWAFPLYVLLVHADFKRFIELIWEREAQGAFAGKYTALIATSIHFFDHTAIRYMHATVDDLDMRYTGYFSAKMDDLLNEKRRKELFSFGQDFLIGMEEGEATLKTYAPLRTEKPVYTPSPVNMPLPLGGVKTLVLTDTTDEETNIGRMVRRYADLTGADVTDLSAVHIISGCIGCIACAFDYECVFHGKDDIETLYEKMSGYDAIIFAGEMRGRYLSSLWKRFFDRRFFRNHSLIYPGKQMGYLISGPLAQESNLLEILQAMAELEECNYLGALTDEDPDSANIDERMDAFAKKMIRFAKTRTVIPQTFLGIGGRKLFRDEIWGPMRFPFRMDYRYYKKHGYYDFPQKDVRSRMNNAFMLFLLKLPKIKKGIRLKMKEHMVGPYKKILQEE
jgi:multimeric flavodoxin WrbA